MRGTTPGPLDLVLLPTNWSNVELYWDDPFSARFFRRLSSVGRLILFDKRGCGLSDPVPLRTIPTVEEWVDDLMAVLSAVGSSHARLIGVDAGGPPALLAAGSHPTRFSTLVLINTFARLSRAPDYPWGFPEPLQARTLATFPRDFATGVLSELMKHLPNARYVELPGGDHLFNSGGIDELAEQIEVFLTETRHTPNVDRVLATVMFTDIVNSTQRAATFGDRRWKELLDHHDDVVSRALIHFRGRQVKSTGDGVLAVFDGPARAVGASVAIRDALQTADLETRCGIHTAEIELRGEDVGGIGVHIAARVSGIAASGQVLASRTVVDLVVGSGIKFEDRGDHELKGVPGEWRLFAVTG